MEKIIILAAGKGKRMGALTADLPKPMLPVRGKPMLEHVLDRARAAGFTQACLVVGYKAEVIEQHFAGYPMDIAYRLQTEINGTAKAALLARDWVGTDPFLLTFGDILAAPADYQALTGTLASTPGAVTTIAINHVDDPTAGAAVYVDEQMRLTRIIEKPPPGTSTTNWNSAGIYALQADFFDELARVPRSPRGEYEITSGLSQLVESGRIVMACPVQAGWRDVGRPEDLKAVNEAP